MRGVWWCLVVSVFISLAAHAASDDNTSFKSLWLRVSTDPDCKSQEFSDFIMFTCEKETTLWYFTKPEHPAYPGVIKRSIVSTREGQSVDENGWSFASDDKQAAFKEWLNQFRQLDLQVREQLQHEHSQQTGEKPN